MRSNKLWLYKSTDLKMNITVSFDLGDRFEHSKGNFGVVLQGQYNHEVRSLIMTMLTINCQARVQTLSRSSPDDYKVTSNSTTISSHKVWTKSWLYNCYIPPPPTTMKLFWVKTDWNLFMKWTTSIVTSSKRLYENIFGHEQAKKA